MIMVIIEGQKKLIFQFLFQETFIFLFTLNQTKNQIRIFKSLLMGLYWWAPY